MDEQLIKDKEIITWNEVYTTLKEKINTGLKRDLSGGNILCLVSFVLKNKKEPSFKDNIRFESIDLIYNALKGGK